MTMMTMDIIKHLAVFDPSKVKGAVAVVGVGALGTAVAIQLAKLGLTNIVLFDDDKVEAHNLPNQILFGPSDIGTWKVDAAALAIHRLTGYQPAVGTDERGMNPDKLESKMQLRQHGVTHVFVCVDSMAARKSIFDNAVFLNPAVTYYCEGRMSSTTGTMYGFNPVEIAKSEAYAQHELYSDNEVTVDRAVCGTILSVGATANMLACAMVWHFMEWVMGVQEALDTNSHPTGYETLAFQTKNLGVHHKALLGK